MRRIAAVDANQSDIVAALRKVGASVQPLHAVGGGVPDILAGKNGVNVLLEIKDGSKPPSKRTLTEAQIEWHANWRGQVCVVSSVAEALDALSNGVALIPFKGVVR
jgi:Holliday junction resolvase